MDISGSSVLVTGAASGLGAATAARFAAAGAQVFGLDLQPSIDKAEPTDGITLIPTDVTDEAQVQSAIDTIAAAGAPLRVAVNCAGVGWASRILTKDGPHDLDLFRKIIDINLVGTFNVMRLAANQMKDESTVDDDGARGVIVNTASVAAFEGQIGQIAYAASKGGVHAMTISAARPRTLRHSRLHHCAGNDQHADARGHHPGVPEDAGRGHSVPAPPRRAGRVRPARGVHRRAQLPQRRDHPNGRRTPDGASLSCSGRPVRGQSRASTPRTAVGRGP